MKDSQFVFAGGAPRSGLTLLRAILHQHPKIYCGSDGGVTPGLPMQWADMATALGDLHANSFNLSRGYVRKQFAKAMRRLMTPTHSMKHPVIVEKTPLNLLAFEPLSALFPNAKFIHVVRDGRDVAASLMTREWRDRVSGAPFAHVQFADAAAAYWDSLARIALKAEWAIDNSNRFLVLRYEEMALKPQSTIKRLCDFLEVKPVDAMMAHHRGLPDLRGLEIESENMLRQPISDRQIGRWRNDLSVEQKQQVQLRAEAMLTAFGYVNS